MKSRISIVIVAMLMFTVAGAWAAKPSYFYQLKIYHLKGKAQNDLIESYLREAYVPAMHRMGIKHVGVFKPIVEDTAEQLIYVFVPAKNLATLIAVEENLQKDKAYLTAAVNYLDAPYNKPAYNRIENIILKAFSAMPEPALPKLTSPKAQRVYELRSYEASTEKLSLNKIEMFNVAEVEIFSKLNFNAVFYGQVISGSRMPNLMYLTTFNDRADRDAHWMAFGPAYKPLKDLPQYQNNVSKNVTLFLYPADYSDY